MPKKPIKKPILTRKQKIAAARSTNNTEGDSSSSPSNVEYLESPLQSNTDKNQYRVIKLANGLTALLISPAEDPISSVWLDETSSSDQSDLSSSNAGNSDCLSSKIPDCKSTEQTEKKTEEPVIRSKGYCRFCVNVGSFSENSGVAGESLTASKIILEGCKKYPQENGFKDYPRTNGGFMGADDCCETTSWYFCVPDNVLPNAIERFAECFVSPLMKKSVIMRRRKELETIYRVKCKYPDYSNRKEQLYSSMAPYYHPISKLRERNLEGMCQASNDKIYREVIKFRERHYSAHRMTAVIEARLPLDTLEQYAVQYFSKIPNNGLPPDDFSKFHYTDSFDIEAFRKMYTMKPPKFSVICDKTLELTWSMPPLQRFYRSKPYKYISWVINNKGKGSLMSYLLKKKWCIDVDSGIGYEDFENNSIWSLFSLTLILTVEGIKNLKKVLEAVYSYIKMLRTVGPEKRIWDEISSIDLGNFGYRDDVRSSNFYQQLCENMHLYPPVDYLTGSVMCFEYDPAAIITWIDLMTPDRANMILYDSNFEESEYVADEPSEDDEPVHIERETYTTNGIPEEWINDWRNMEPLIEFALPELNNFVTNNYTITYPYEPTHGVIKIHSDVLSELWYKQPLRIRLPKSYISFCLVTSLPLSSPENAAMLDMLKFMLSQLFVTALYPATVAGLKYHVGTCAKGLEVHVNGWSKKLPLLMQTIIKDIAECSNVITEKLFDLTKLRLLKAYHDIFNNSETLARDVRRTILGLANWTSVDMHAALVNLQYNEYQHFIQHFTDHIYLQGLAQGDIAKSTAIANTIRCYEILNCEPPLPNTMPQLRINEIPRGSHCCRIKSFATVRPVTCVTNYYQFGDSSVRCVFMIDLLVMLMNNRLFEEFQNNEILKDHNCRLSKDHIGSAGYSITTETDTCLGAEQAVRCDEEIEKFRKNLKKVFENLAEREWLYIKNVISRVDYEKYEHLREGKSENWIEIISGEFVFDRRAKQAEEIKILGIEDLKKCLIDLTTESPDLRKLSVQVVGISEIGLDSTTGTHDGDDDSKNLNFFDICGHRIKYLIDSPELHNEATNDYYYITDINDYKRELEALPVTIEDDVNGITEGMENIWQKYAKNERK